MSLKMHGTQYGLSQHNKILQNVSLIGCVVNIKLNVKWACSCYIALP